RRVARDDKKLTALQDCAVRKVVMNVAVDAEARKVLEVILPIEDLDVFEAQAWNFRGMIHDFRNDEAGAARTRPKRFKGQREAVDDSAAARKVHIAKAHG